MAYTVPKPRRVNIEPLAGVQKVQPDLSPADLPSPLVGTLEATLDRRARRQALEGLGRHLDQSGLALQNARRASKLRNVRSFAQIMGARSGEHTVYAIHSPGSMGGRKTPGHMPRIETRVRPAHFAQATLERPDVSRTAPSQNDL